MPNANEATTSEFADASARRRLRVAVVGAGAGGICMAVGLRRLGIEDFTVFEKSDGVGGTWYDNTFPGAEVDTPVPFYSFSFHAYDFTRTHVRQAELLAYLRNVVDRFRLMPHIKLRTGVTRAVWDEQTHTYEVHTTDGNCERFHVVVTAVGLLNNPRYPDWPGLDRFQGPAFHSARWDHGVDLSGKRVAVAGTGSTAAQIVPAIAPQVEKLYVFQRQPGWILPKPDREFTAAERARMSRPLYRRWRRLRQGMVYQGGVSFIEGTKANVQAQRTCEAFIRATFRDRPDLQKLVTPDYPFGGKRPVKESKFYPALLRDNVELVPHAVSSVTEHEVVDDTGYGREVDVIVMATGFTAASFLSTMDVVGRDGRSIHDIWQGDAQAFLGLTVANFPNFYMLYGPNTNGAPIMFMHERQTEFVIANLKRMLRRNVTAIEVRKPVMDVFNRVVQRRLERNVAGRYPEVHNYGRSPSGRNVIGWGEGMKVYALLTRTTPWLSATARRLEPDPATRNGRPDHPRHGPRATAVVVGSNGGGMAEQDFAGKVALVTGGSRGIGFSIAHQLAVGGAQVVITARKADELAEAVELLSQHTKVVAVRGSTEDEAHQAEAVNRAVAELGGLDILVNNAGFSPAYKPLVDTELRSVRKVFEVNTFAVVGWTARAWHAWMGEHGGVVLNIASMGGLHPSRGLGSYSASKAAVIHLTRQLAQELAPTVRVNAMAPAVIKTRFTEPLFEGREPEIAAKYPLGRMGTTEDTAELAAFLLSPRSGWITGQTVALDGGALIASR